MSDLVLSNLTIQGHPVGLFQPGQTFDEVTISRDTESQTWTKYNLSIDDGGEGIVVKDNVTANNVNFGTQYYYTWDAAVRVANSIDGWHLPSNSEWNKLIYIVTGTTGAYSIAAPKVKSTTGWNNNANGDGTYGFDIFPVGYLSQGYLSSLGGASDFWTSNEQSSSDARYRWLNTGNALNNSTGSKNRGFSVRLIKDT